MRLVSRRAAFVCALLVFLLIPKAWGLAGDGNAPLSPDEQRQVTRLLSQFRTARGEPEQQAAIVEAAAALGEPALRQLQNAIATQLYPSMKRYRGQFYSQASRMTRSRLGNIDLNEVGRLREAVHSLRNGGNFTKEAIVQTADPAVARLGEIFLVERTEVLAASASLQADRQELFEVGSLWEQCTGHLYRFMPDDENKQREPASFETYLQGEEQLAAGLAAPMSPQTKAIISANHRLASRLDPEEARAILALNLTRNLLGLTPLAIDLRLCGAARDHSTDMQQLKFFSHTSPVEGKASFVDRAARFGVQASGENIYVGAQDGRAANTAWFHSPGHHANMLANHKRVGVGRSGSYFTQLFGR